MVPIHLPGNYLRIDVRHVRNNAEVLKLVEPDIFSLGKFGLTADGSV